MYALIYLLVSSDEHHVIAQASIGSDVWPFLKAKFEKDVASNCLNLRNNFYNVTHDPSKPATKFINTIQFISHQLAIIKHPLHATEIIDMILLCLHESFSPVCSTLITCKEEPTLTEIITAVKEHEAHMAMTNCLPKRTSGSNEIGSENIYFAGRQQKQGGVQRSASKAEVDWGNSKGKDGVCFCCGCPGHVAAKCIAEMPQEVKDHIISGTAYVTREDESDESVDDDMTEAVAFAKDNPHVFALMANTLRPTCDHKDKMDVAQTLMEFAHVASDIQWEPKFTGDKNQALVP